MVDEISKIYFDIAIIGCGAYGLLFAARIKKDMKRALYIWGHHNYYSGLLEIGGLDKHNMMN